MVSKKPELKDTSPIKSVLSLPNTKTNQKPSKIIITKKQIIKSSPIPVDNTENDSDKSQNLTNFKPLRFRADPLSFIIKGTTELSAFYSGAGWRAYEEYIGTKILYPEYTLSIKKALLGSDRVKSAINKLLEEAPEKERQKKKHILWRETESIANKMIAEMDSIKSLRGFAFVINNILVKMYHQGIHIQEREYLRLKNVALYAQENNLSMIFLPCHKSHIDYLVISYIFFRLGLALPHIAAGENLNMPVVGNILKKNGAFFIRRQWGNDAIYLALMKEYLELLLERGHNIEAFIEGTRSRMGKLLQPKFGILKIILDSVLAEKRIKDCIIVPMSIGYDKVIEASGYINELLGTPKEKESLLQLLSNFNILSLKWGRIDVRFAEPFSLKDYIHSQIERRGPSFQPSSSPADKDLLLQSLGFRVLGDINEVSVVMPTALVGTVLLTLRGRGVGRDELIRKVNWLKREILKKNGRVADFGTMSTGEIVDRAIPVLKDLISVRSDLLEPVFYPNKRFELSLYRNQVIHLFISESVLSTALYATIKAGGPHQSQKIKYQKLCDDIGFLSSLLKYEFIFQFGGLEEVTSKTLDELVKSNVMAVEVERGEPGQAYVEESSMWVKLSAEERRIGREHFDFYCFLLWPFIESYWLAVVSLFSLVHDNFQHHKPILDKDCWIDERVFLNRCQFFGKSLYYEGDLSYFEAVNIETIKNAVKRLREMGMIVHHKGPTPPFGSFKEDQINQTLSKKDETSSSEKNVSWIALHPSWFPPERLPSVPLPTTWKDGLVQHGEETDTNHLPQNEEASNKSFFLNNNFNKNNNANKTSTLKTKSDDNSTTESKRTTSKAEEDDYLSKWYELQPSGKLWDFSERIGSYRREGKNRRDTSTVAIRVLRLARMTNSWVFDPAGKKKPVPKGGKKAIVQGVVPAKL